MFYLKKGVQCMKNLVAHPEALQCCIWAQALGRAAGPACKVLSFICVCLFESSCFLSPRPPVPTVKMRTWILVGFLGSSHSARQVTGKFLAHRKYQTLLVTETQVLRPVLELRIVLVAILPHFREKGHARKPSPLAMISGLWYHLLCRWGSRCCGEACNWATVICKQHAQAYVCDSRPCH